MKKNIFSVIVILVAIVGTWYLVKLQHPLPPEPPQPITALFSCDNSKTLSAIFYQGQTQPPVSEGQPPMPGGRVDLVLDDGRTMTLNQTISADGARYANADESFVFWNKGNGALVLENNKEKSYTGCIVVAPQPVTSNLSGVYSSGSNGFSIRLPDGYTIDEKYQYQMDPQKIFGGVKFTIPAAVADGTNLGHDSYLSVETLPKVENCTADLFLDQGHSAPTELVENGMTYSVASSTGAGAGNRYEETVYAIPGSNPCRAVRYFVHYSVIENYPAGTVHEFDKSALINQFNMIRGTLVTL